MQKRPDCLRTDRERTETAQRPEIAGPEHHYWETLTMLNPQSSINFWGTSFVWGPLVRRHFDFFYDNLVSNDQQL